ncbi:MAG: DUF418 domain-containing protein [Bacteroidales bacterium]|nr:DUF418 domain-containing protein [Bacteroidales bacterium]
MSIIQLRATGSSERITSVDILRGFALFGIALVNVFGFNASFFDFGGFYSRLPDPEESKFYRLMISLCADKFIFLYSFLFGYGFFLQFEKFRAEKTWFSDFYKRRLLFLALFGLMHIVFLWAGDILLLYALAGTLLFLIRNLKSGPLLGLGIFFYFFIGFWLMAASRLPLPDALSSTCTDCLSDAQEIYPAGGFFDCLLLRLKEYLAFRNINLFYYLPKIMGVFIFGFMAGRLKIHQKVKKNPVKSLIVTSLTGIAAALLYFYYETLIFLLIPEGNPLLNAMYMTAYEFTNLFMAGFYILLVLWMASVPFTGRLLIVFAWPGRLSLTNYIVQSVAFSVIMYGWGFGKFGMQTPTVFIWYPVIIFGFQALFSYLWLKRFSQGPLEMLWRWLSYRN